MVNKFNFVALLTAALAAVSSAQLTPECGRTLGGTKCGEKNPCCSQFGVCGVGAYCLGGCDPMYSNSKEACVPRPVCRSGDYKFNNLNRVMSNTKYLGDSSKTDWVWNGPTDPIDPSKTDNALVMYMKPESYGVVVSSTFEVFYGKVSATMRSSRGKGVVSAFILFSDVQDEIDYEWVGNDLTHVQTNYYFQGIPEYGKGGMFSTSNTFENWNTYEIDWTPEKITWSVNGVEGRVLKREDTWNATSKRYHYPQTPSRIQFSIWPGGAPSNAEGTIEWAGGVIDWVNHPDIKNNGYYYAMVKDVKVECYDPPKGVKKSGNKAYVFNGDAYLEDSVEITNDNTALKSLFGTGLDMDKEPPSDTKGDTKETDLRIVPGNDGVTLSNNQQHAGDKGGNNGGSQSDGGNSYSEDAATDFSQNGDNTSNAAALKGSLFAVFMALLGAIAL